MATCISCHAPIVWGVTDAGRSIPVDAEPAADGNLAIGHATPGARGAMRVRYLGKDDTVRTSEWRGVAHFVTCPDAKMHRKSR